jgi:hypothetical protein
MGSALTHLNASMKNTRRRWIRCGMWGGVGLELATLISDTYIYTYNNTSVSVCKSGEVVRCVFAFSPLFQTVLVCSSPCYIIYVNTCV